MCPRIFKVKPTTMKTLITCICFTFAFTLSAQDSKSYKSLDWSIGAHFQTRNSLGIYATWEKNSTTYLYADFSFTAEKYTYYENISYYEALVVYEDRQLDDYPSSAAFNIGYVFSNDVEQIRPFIYGGINDGIRHVGFKDEFYILSNSGNYSVDLPNSGYTKFNVGGGLMIPLSDGGELKISADANPPSLHNGIGLVNWSKAKK